MEQYLVTLSFLQLCPLGGFVTRLFGTFAEKLDAVEHHYLMLLLVKSKAVIICWAFKERTISNVYLILPLLTVTLH